MREDRVFWAILSAIVIVILVTGVVVALRHRTELYQWKYRTDESKPENVVYNAYVAALYDDVDRFLSYFATPPYGEHHPKIVHLHVEFVRHGELRIGTAAVEGDTAYVPVYLIREYTEPFWGRRVHVEVRSVHLKRQNGQWRLTQELPGVYPEFEAIPIPIPPRAQPDDTAPQGGD